MTFAARTDVPVAQSEAEIRTLLRRAGADRLLVAEEPGAASVIFELAGRRIAFRLPLPRPDDEVFGSTPGGKPRSADARRTAWDQVCRSRWRALYLVIRAKLESVASGIESAEDAFLSHVVMPDGSTVGDAVRPRIAEVYRTERMVPLLAEPAR